MKKCLTFLMSGVFLYSCGYEKTEIGDPKNNLNLNGTPVIDYQDEPFTFEKVTKPEVWRTFNNLEEMLEACQLPEGMLSVMSTRNLIQTLMNHPLFFIYTAYNNELDGVNVIIDNFNGFEELQKREDVAEAIIDYYAAINLKNIVGTTKLPSLLPDLTIIHLGYLELVIASKKIPEIFNAKYIDKLNNAMLEMYDAKLSLINEIDLSSINKSLLLGAQIQLSKNLISLEERKILQEFVDKGGNVSEESMYTTVSQIINSK